MVQNVLFRESVAPLGCINLEVLSILCTMNIKL